MLTRRQFLVASAALTGVHTGCVRRPPDAVPAVVNDVHSQLNATRVARVVAPASSEALEAVVRRAREAGQSLSIAGGRHAMGGQQFGEGTVLVDTTGLNRVLGFDRDAGLVEVQAGIQWPALIDHLLRVQEGHPRPWGIVQKQTGADRLSIGGALAANVHGRGLRFRPFVQDVESFVLLDAEGRRRRCSRQENSELFRLAIGGYGLFGIVESVTLRLTPRRAIERIVEILDADALMPAFERRIREGFTFGDWQYATDPGSDDFLRRGVFSCYRPVAAADVGGPTRELALDDWKRLLYLSHADKARAFQQYAGYYLSTSGQGYWSDTHQLSVYVDDYHRALDRELGSAERATEVITEVYVRRSAVPRFLTEVRRDFRQHAVDVIYGTIRLIEADTESFLAWAREPYACIIFNLHTVHTATGRERSAEAFRRLIDRALAHGGNYYLTYHRHATRRQVEACYPQFAEFLRLKRRYDPEERFQSDWYRHYRAMFADALSTG